MVPISTITKICNLMIKKLFDQHDFNIFSFSVNTKAPETEAKSSASLPTHSSVSINYRLPVYCMIQLNTCLMFATLSLLLSSMFIIGGCFIVIYHLIYDKRILYYISTSGVIKNKGVK